MTITSVDPAALRAAAQRIDVAADALLEAVIVPLRFDGAVAGRAHGLAGGDVRAAIDVLVARARNWALTAHEVTNTLREAASRWADTEDRSAAVLR